MVQKARQFGKNNLLLKFLLFFYSATKPLKESSLLGNAKTQLSGNFPPSMATLYFTLLYPFEPAQSLFLHFLQDFMILRPEFLRRNMQTFCNEADHQYNIY